MPCPLRRWSHNDSPLLDGYGILAASRRAIEDLRALHDSGITTRVLGSRCGVSHATIQRLLRDDSKGPILEVIVRAAHGVEAIKRELEESSNFPPASR